MGSLKVNVQGTNVILHTEIETIKAELTKADVIFEHFSTAQAPEKQEMFVSLKNTSLSILNFQSPELSPESSQKLMQLATRTLYLFGRCFYGQSMETSRQFFLLALAAQSAADKIFLLTKLQSLFDCTEFLKCETLDEVKAHLLAQPSDPNFDEIEGKIDSTKEEEMVSVLAGKPTEAFTVASTYRWLGHSLQNIVAYKNANFHPLFVKIYDLSKAVFGGIKTVESDLEIAHVLYNSGRFMHKLLQPNDSVGALKTLDAVIDILKERPKHPGASQLRAQMHNILVIENFGEIKAEKGSEAEKSQLHRGFVEASKARKIAEECEGFDLFLKAMFLHNKAMQGHACLTAEVLDAPSLDVIGNWMDHALKEREEAGFNHIYDPGFLRNGATIAQAQNLLDLADTRLKLAEAVEDKLKK